MIDVVFLLLIFFMTTSGFVKTERELDPTIQTRRQSGGGAAKDLEPALVEVTRGISGFVYKLGGREFKKVEALIELLQKFPNKQEGAFVRVQDDAPFEMAAAAIQAGKTAGFAMVSYLPAEEK